MSKLKTTHPKVFIIESLDFEDEDKGLYEGSILSDILSLSKVETKYYYVRTKQEFKEVINLFEKSKFRYLFLVMEVIIPFGQHLIQFLMMNLVIY